MLIVLSPAKALDFTPAAPDMPLTLPQMRDQTAELAKATRKLTRPQIKRLMSISDKLADLNYRGTVCMEFYPKGDIVETLRVARDQARRLLV